MALDDIRDYRERSIARQIVGRALANGWAVSVNDNEVWVLNKSTDRAAIFAAMGTTDDDTLGFHDADGVFQGVVWLIWGNGEDVVSDCSDRPAILELWAWTADQPPT